MSNISPYTAFQGKSCWNLLLITVYPTCQIPVIRGGVMKKGCELKWRKYLKTLGGNKKEFGRYAQVNITNKRHIQKIQSQLFLGWQDIERYCQNKISKSVLLISCINDTELLTPAVLHPDLECIRRYLSYPKQKAMFQLNLFLMHLIQFRSI